MQRLKNCIMLLKCNMFFHSTNIHLAPTTCQALVLLLYTLQTTIIDILKETDQSVFTDQVVFNQQNKKKKDIHKPS